MNPTDIYETEFTDLLGMIYPWEDRYKSYFSFLKHIVGSYNSKSVLDAGCGDGLQLYIFNELHKMKRIVGVDSSAAMITKTKNNLFKRSYSNTEIIQADITKLANSVKGSFDLITCNFTLSTLDNKVKIINTLHQFKKLLSKGGMLIIEDTNGDRLIDRTPPPELLYLSSDWHWLLNRNSLKIQVYEDLALPIQIKKIRKYWNLYIRSNFLYHWLQPNNFCYRTYQVNGSHVFTNYLIFQSGLIRRPYISLHRTICWLLTKKILLSYLKKAGFRVESTYSDHELHSLDNSAFGQIVVAKRM